jgi:dipeptidyl-peptidase-4
MSYSPLGAGAGPSRDDDVEDGHHAEDGHHHETLESLPAYKQHQRRTKMLIAFAVLTVIVTIIVVPIAIVKQHHSDPSKPPTPHQAVFGFNDIFSKTPAVPTVSFTNAGDLFQMRSDGNIYRVPEGTVVVALDPSFSDFVASDDGQYFLLARNVTSVFRHSTVAQYYLYDSKRGVMKKVFDGSAVTDESLALFSPGNQVATVQFAVIKANNIFYCTWDGTTLTSTQVTTSATDFRVRNGLSDWLYEEEVLESQVSLWFSRSGSRFVYFEYNDTFIEDFAYPLYDVTTPGDSIQHIAYPNPGFPNPQVNVYVYNTGNGDRKLVYSTTTQDTLVFGSSWYGDDQFALRIMNRVQNESQINVYDKDGNPLAAVSQPEKQVNGWIIPRTAPIFLTPSSYVDLRWQQSNTDGKSYQHLAIVSADKITFLTSGSWNVYSILCVDPTSGDIVIQSPGPSAPQWDNHVWKINANVANPQLVQLDTSGATFATASFGTSCSVYMLNEQSVTQVPRYTFVTATKPLVVEDNSAYAKSLAGLALPQRKYVTLTEDNFNGYVVLPPNYSPSKSYALIMHPYGGPGSMMCVSKFVMTDAFESFLPSNYDVIIAVVDGLGTGAKDADFLYSVYLQLGINEIKSQVRAVAALLKMYPNIDANRVGFYGWSFGGMQGANAATYSAIAADGKNPFVAAVSIAPVSDWHFYDSAYTERYMRTPQQNPDGYRATSVLQRADATIQNYALNFGSGDDNVHPTNSFNWINSLIAAGKTNVDLFVYPNRQHGIADQPARFVLWNRVLSFFRDSLALSSSA